MDLKNFDISFEGLKLGKHHFSFEVDRSFLDLFEYERCHEASLYIDVVFEKKERLFELDFKIKGATKVTCDISLENFELPIENSLQLVVKYGQVYNNDSDEVLIIPHSAHKVNIAQYIYEGIVVAIPSKLEHPGIADGTLKSDIVDRLEKLSPKEWDAESSTPSSDDQTETDPRWDKLKDLL